MTIEMKHFPTKNLNPLLSVTKYGTILYSNEAGEPLLNEWGVGVGEKLPLSILDIVQRVISQNCSERIETKIGKKVYLVVFQPLPEEERVDIYGFDINNQKELEEKLYESNKIYHLLFENMLDGLSYCRILYDDCGYPVDFIYLDTNRAFEQLTGLREVNGKRATELFPGIKESHQELFDIFRRVVLTGKPERFDLEFKPLRMWFSISVYSVDREHFVVVFNNITERKRTEAAIKKSRFILAKSQEMAHVGNWAWNVQTGEMNGSDENYRIYGYEPGDISSDKDWAMARTHPDDRELLADFFHMVKQDGMHKSVDYRIIRLDGNTRYVTTVADKIVMDKAGKVKWIYGITQDITERKKIEEALRESEKKFRTLFENASVAIFIADIVTGEILDCNQNAEKLIGRSHSEIIGLHQTQLHPADKAQYFSKMFANHLYDTVTKNYEAEVQNSDGRVIPVLINATPLKINNRNVMIGFFLDITERKRTEEALRENEMCQKVTEAVEVERQRLYNVLETLPVMICLLKPDYQVVFANRSYREKFGESCGLHCYESRFGRTQPCEFCESYKVFKTGQKYNCKVTIPDGSVIDTYNLPFTDYDGTPMILKMDIDITKRKEAEETLAKIELARQKEIHHRIKNNLQVILSLLNLQVEQFNNREYIKKSEVLEAFKESKNRVISMALIHEELHKGEGFESLNFSSYIEDLADNLLLTYKLGNKNINLKTDLDQNVFLDMDNAVPLGIIVNELVSNSFKYAFPEKNDGEIKIKLRRKESNNNSFILMVSDNGVGIPENIDIEDLDSLGLQLVSTLVDQLNGELELKRNNGTEFTIRFTIPKSNNPKSVESLLQLTNND
jgi:PAS domain S-box-containing protein